MLFFCFLFAFSAKWRFFPLGKSYFAKRENKAETQANLQQARELKCHKSLIFNNKDNENY